MDNKNHHCLIIDKSLLFYLRDIVKGVWCSWFNFPSITLESYNFLSCAHFGQYDPKPIGRGKKIMYTFYILIDNKGDIYKLGKLVHFKRSATADRSSDVFDCGIYIQYLVFHHIFRPF